MRKTERGTTFVFFRPTHLHDETKTAPPITFHFRYRIEGIAPGAPLFSSNRSALPFHPPPRFNSSKYQELDPSKKERENIRIAFIISEFPGDNEEIERRDRNSSIIASIFTLILWWLKSYMSYHSRRFF